ncbi:MAG TPA: DUF5701 family protein, partial [Terrimesophilobacter sp.]|nr:DUF5701 family protein [Terrimesophilobacter sp.]
AHQVEQLIDLGVPALARRSDEEFRMLTHPFDVDTAESGTALVVVHPSLVPASALASLLRLNDKAGFVVVDMVDVDGFVPIGSITVPDTPLYLVRDLDRGDDLSNWSPDEALPELERRGRRPLTVSEGISWLLQSPGTLEPNRCFMTIGSRKSKGTGFDSRVPAIWISRGTGRDGADSNGAPKVGWCWAGNRHTWLGIASAAAS